LAEIRETSGTGERRRAREYALQLLFQLDLSPEPPGNALLEFWKGKRIKPSVIEFAGVLVKGAMEQVEWLDSVLGSISHHWRVPRMAVVDRNILRIALYELVYENSTPPIVVIDEAIEIAKKFGNEESGPFVNGILDAVRLRIESGEIILPAAAGEPATSPPLKVRTPA